MALAYPQENNNHRSRKRKKVGIAFTGVSPAVALGDPRQLKFRRFAIGTGRYAHRAVHLVGEKNGPHGSVCVR